MTRREARRVALLVASRVLDGFCDAGALHDSPHAEHLSDRDVDRIDAEIRAIADSLDAKGRRHDGPIVTLSDAIKVAGVGE